MVIAAIFAIVLISTEICYFVAKRRNLNKAVWIMLGATLGPIAVPFVFLAGKANN